MQYFQRKLQMREKQREQEKAQDTTALQGVGSFSEQSATGGMGQSMAEQRQGAGGFQGERSAFSATVQGDNPNRQIMRDEYGWKMTEDQYKRLNKDTGEFNKSIAQYKRQADQKINQYKSKTQAEIAAEEKRYGSMKTQLTAQEKQAKAELARAREKLGKLPSQDKVFGDWYRKEKMAVTVWDGQNRQGTYWVPRSVVKELNKKVEGTWLDKGKAYGVNVRQGGRMRGQEMHDMLREELNRDKVEQMFWKKPEIQGSYRQSIKDWGAANKQLNTAQSKLNASMAEQKSALHQFNTNIQRSKQNLQYGIKRAQLERDTATAKARSARQGKIDAAKTAYEKRSALRRKAYQNMKNISGHKKTPAQGNQGQTNE